MDELSEEDLESYAWDRTFRQAGYVWCRPDQEWHRPPECPIGEDGNPNPYWLDDSEDE